MCDPKVCKGKLASKAWEVFIANQNDCLYLISVKYITILMW
jgi:hypothetical protein